MGVSERLEKLQSKMTKKELPSLLISQPENRFYLSGFNGSAGYLLITKEKRILATDFRYTEQAAKEAPEYETFQLKGEIAEWFPKLVIGLKGELGFEAGNLTFALYQRFNEALSKAGVKLNLKPTDNIAEDLRSVKEPGEVALIKEAVQITDRAFAHIQDRIHAGMTEKNVAWEIEKFMREHGSEAVAFEAIVAAGPASAMPHARPSEHAIQPGEPIIIDIGARYESYASDLTRTICLGTPTDKFREVYQLVLQAQLKAEAEIRAGMTGTEADAISRKVITDAGYGDNFGHGLGHGVGLQIHESPRLGIGSKDILADGMVFSVEPGVYLTGWGGVRIEDTVFMENDRVRPLTRSRK
ncbi:MAG: aminopeptidase P family protein [Chloroflexota bacterium]